MPCCASESCGSSAAASADSAFRRVLWIVLVVNVGMFVLALAAGLLAGSAALQADALDFLADAANYAISLIVLGLNLRWRAGAAWIKGASMAAFGIWVLGTILWHMFPGSVPDAPAMGIVGTLALIMNLVRLVLLISFRSGDANMRSVRICSRNDVIANTAVLFAALGVFGTGRGWPDFVVASLMAVLALDGAWQIMRDAAREWRGLGGPHEHAPAAPVLR